MDSRTRCVIVSITFVLSNILIVMIFKYPDVIPARPLHQALQRMSELNYTSIDELRYENMTEKYNNMLALMPRHKYSPSEAFIDIGPPMPSLHNTSHNESKLILLWTTFFYIREWVFQDKSCPVSCLITTNKSDLPRSEALIMHPRDMPAGTKSLPGSHPPWQRWVYFLQESPFHTGINVGHMNNIFNYTATYRLDSDLYVGYGEMKKRPIPMETAKLDDMVSDIVKTKRKLVAARISNCNRGKTERLSYIAELKKYISVDFYGGCGNIPCSRKKGCDELMKQYKFYLAFENSHCRDYITEKFWLPLYQWRSVPVVMGTALQDYEAVAPSSAFIHTFGFSSAKQLAEYLQLLDRNDHLYKRYFAWHKYWQPSSTPWVCNLCKDMYNVSAPSRSYRDFKGWYREEYCKF